VLVGGLAFWVLTSGDEHSPESPEQATTTTGVAAPTTSSPSSTTTAPPPASVPAEGYEVLDLGDLGGSAHATDVNASGLVVGTSATGVLPPVLGLATERSFEAFAWDPATEEMTGLGALALGCSPGWAARCEEEGIEILPQSVDSSATAINAAGIVVGWSGSLDCTEPVMCRATRWDLASGTIDDLGTLAGDDVEIYDVGSIALDVNDAGLVVGRSTTSSGEHHAFVWDPTTRVMRDLGTLGGSYSEAHAVNERGEVTGYSTTASGANHLFVWTAESGMTDLGTLGDGSGAVDPQAIAEDGTIVGTHGDGRVGFVRWSDSREFEDLGSLVPSDLDASGLVVGARIDPFTSESVPIVMSRVSGVVVELPGPPGMSGPVLGSANAVDAGGTIVGSVLHSGRSIAVRWTPIPDG
jgi:probable HAF family extracellular repeat protein